MTVGFEDFARSMRDPEIREQRRSMLDRPHIRPLTSFVEELRREKPNAEVPDFDPFDGGIDAGLLFLMEKPGPMTTTKSGKVGSGFISRNNDDSSAEATFDFMNQAQIPRGLTVTWNIIPYWNGTIKTTTAEIAEGIQCTRRLIKLLPKLRVIVFVGRKAEKVRGEFSGHKCYFSFHPSPRSGP